MAPWSWWPQSTPPNQQQQQQQQPQEEPPLSPPTPKTSHPPLNQSSNLLSKDRPQSRFNEIWERKISPAELRDITARSLQTGAVTGSFGLLVGAGSGIIRSAPPVFFALFAGFQWFALGSTYIGASDLLSHALGGEDKCSSSDRLMIGGISGAVSGMCGGIIRGPKNIIPGALVFGVLGTGGTFVSQFFQTDKSKPKTSWLDSKWSPMQRLSDKQYIDKLEEKVLRLDAQIAIVDETIASLRQSAQAPVTPAQPTANEE